MDTSTPIDKAVAAAGSLAELARRLGVTYQTIQQWKDIPAKRVADVERATGVPRHELRPDLYDAPQVARETSADADTAVPR